MAFTTNPLKQVRTEQFQTAAARLNEIAAEIDRMALLLDETAVNCEACGSAHYNNWPQRQLRSRVTGAADRLREIGGVFRQRANDAEFLGDQSPGLARLALDAVNIENCQPNSDGYVEVAFPVWDIIKQALGHGVKVERDHG